MNPRTVLDVPQEICAALACTLEVPQHMFGHGWRSYGYCLLDDF